MIIGQKNHITSDNDDTCATSWLLVMLSDQILVSRTKSHGVNEFSRWVSGGAVPIKPLRVGAEDFRGI
jgi:hypothetical protein